MLIRASWASRASSLKPPALTSWATLIPIRASRGNIITNTIDFNPNYNRNNQFFYVVTWNVKTYVSHPLKCRMSQNWLKWCSDTPPPPPPLNSTWLFGLRNFSCQSLRWWWWGCLTPDPPTTTPKLQLDFLDLENFLFIVWGGGGGGCPMPDPPPPPLNSTCFTYKY